jgi:hypothetical protein
VDDLARSLLVLARADAAEVRGDAWAALELIRRNPDEPDGRPFWRPWRVRMLCQLVEHAPLLPRWATSRWILAQALQRLDGSSRNRVGRALEIAGAMNADARALFGGDIDARCRLMDHDWVYRQLHLYELGGLSDFLRSGASSDLLAGADRIHDWASAPMGGYRRLDETPREISWEGLATGARRDVPNLGAAVAVKRGECVIGRVVPIQGGSMFETAPLVVPEEVARRVASEPADWVETLTAACRADRRSQGIHTGPFDFPLLTDVADAAWRSEARQKARWLSPDLPGFLVDAASVCRSGIATFASGASPASRWPCLAAAFVQPGLSDVLAPLLGPDDEERLFDLAERLPEPAAGVVFELAMDCREAA